MSLLPIVMLVVVTVLIVPPFLYYQFMKRVSKRPYNLKSDFAYTPLVTLILPTYNEASIIDKKLHNLENIDYPSEGLEIIIVDSASSDRTLDKCGAYLREKPLKFRTTLLSEERRMGKSHALNTALEHARGEIIATTDADSFWKADALRAAVSYFADPAVGAVSGHERIINANQNDYTLAEHAYREYFYRLRLGESKLHSTLLFQGELSLYRRSAFNRFEDRPGYSDDTGTVLKIISRLHRTIFAPDAVFFDSAPYTFRDRLSLKSRRGQHVISAALASIRLRGILPLEIIVFTMVFNVVCPVIFSIALALSAVIIYSYNLWWVLPIAIPVLVLRKLRIVALSYVTSNLALILAMVYLLFGMNSRAWKKIERMRTVYQTIDFDQLPLKSSQTSWS